MTESKWLTATSPKYLLEFLRPFSSDRKFRLFACAECRRQQSNIVRESAREALDVVERYAAGQASDDELGDARKLIFVHPKNQNWSQSHVDGMVRYVTSPDSEMYAAALFAIASKPHALLWQAQIVRDIFGNPFRPVASDPRWRTETAVALARGVYDDRAFDRLPILADALQDAGCENADVLGHCRGAGPHVRGCWVVDSVLGKE